MCSSDLAPGGLELLARHLPMAASIADFVGKRFAEGNVVTPLASDDDNLPLLTFSFSVAATAAGPRVADNPLLPCERSDVLTHFDDSRVTVAATPRYFAVTNLSKGGVLRVFDRKKSELAYEDSGFVLETDDSEWVSHHLGESQVDPVTDVSRALVKARFAAMKHEVLTPLKFMILRVLNLTVFRSIWLGALVRRMIIARLITGRRSGSWTLKRSLSFEESRVVVNDEVAPDMSVRVTFATLERSLLPMHMGSAKYFHTNELIGLAPPILDGWCSALSSGRPARLTQVIDFGEDGTVRVDRRADLLAGGSPLTDSTERMLK